MAAKQPSKPATKPATKSSRKPLREISPTEDPCCSCEPEPRWRHFQEQTERPNTPDEWESLERSPKDEL
jgi:hypothetical protein